MVDSVIPQPPSLNYAPRPSTPRRWLRRLRRYWLLEFLAVLGALCIVYGPRAVRHWQLLRLQEACLTAHLSGADVPVVELNPNCAQVFLESQRSGYISENGSRGVRRPVDSRWLAFTTELNGCKVAKALWAPNGTLFLHERRTPSGRRRLVVVQTDDFHVTVIEPAGMVSDIGAVNESHLSKPFNASAFSFDHLYNFQGMWSTSISAGVLHASDPSRFSFRVTALGVEGWIDCQLQDDSTVTSEFREWDKFSAGIAAMHLQAKIEEEARQEKLWSSPARVPVPETPAPNVEPPPLTAEERYRLALVALRDSDPAARNRAAREIMRLSREPASLVKALVRATESGDLPVRMGFTLALERGLAHEGSASANIAAADSEPDPTTRAYLRAARRAMEAESASTPSQ